MSEAVLRTEKLFKIYEMGKRKVPALFYLNLQVNKGEVVVREGP